MAKQATFQDVMRKMHAFFHDEKTNIAELRMHGEGEPLPKLFDNLIIACMIHPKSHIE